MTRRSLIDPDHNCWRVGEAAEAAVLVDAASYFESLHKNLRQAKRSIYILGWDIDSRQSLVPGKEEVDGWPVRVGELLDRLARQTPELHIHVLTWDYSSIYIMGREAFQTVKLGWSTHERVHFRFDAEHPAWGSHHQKVVVIDDQIAYDGGLDLTGARWDTTRHEADDPLRRLPTGMPYAPFHDVQMLVTGEPARWFAELARQRWLLATGERLPRAASQDDPGRFVLPPEKFLRPRVALARTVPGYKTWREVREVERLFVDMIDAAEDYLYLENQYFTSTVIVAALVRSLRRARGPEVLLVMPKMQDSWLSQRTMGSLSSLALREVRQADRHGRFRVVYPEDVRLEGGRYINVHSKVMVVDGVYLRIGSANLNNRSMGLDTEADLVVDATQDAAARLSIRELVGELVGHHCGASREEALTAWRRQGSLRQIVDALRGRGPKSLEDYRDGVALGRIDSLLAGSELVDPERPMGLDQLIDDFVFRGKAATELTLRERIPTGYWLTLACCLLLAFLRFLTPARYVLDEDYLRQTFASWGLTGPAEAWFLIGFVLLGSLGVPLNALVALAACMFHTLPALGVALVGGVVVAAIGYALGALLSERFLARLLRRALYYLRLAVVRSSVVALFLVRLFPIAPYAWVNLAAGHARVAAVPYFAGTLLGLTPGVLGIVIFHRSLLRAIEEPRTFTVARFALVLVGMTAGFYALSRRLGQRQTPTSRFARSVFGDARAAGAAS
jgi:phosphatidylserine/phosphatidylglycerophosphate/cardiolipin synthase-like enzyme/uncharacterized membrane protein YdjX (TVP38/TMEM64 family)